MYFQLIDNRGNEFGMRSVIYALQMIWKDFLNVRLTSVSCLRMTTVSVSLLANVNGAGVKNVLDWGSESVVFIEICGRCVCYLCWAFVLDWMSRFFNKRLLEMLSVNCFNCLTKIFWNFWNFNLDFLGRWWYNEPVNRKEGNTERQVRPTSYRKTPTYNITQHHDLSQ